jgi:hypothetical protein
MYTAEEARAALNELINDTLSADNIRAMDFSTAGRPMKLDSRTGAFPKSSRD